MTYRKIIALVALTLCSSSVLANAATATGAGTLPWEAPLALIVASMTGPVAYAMSIIGIIIAMGIIIFGNDLNAFGRTIFYIVLVISILVASVNVLAGLFTTGATFAPTTVMGSVLLALMSISAASSALQMGALKLAKRFLVKRDDDSLAAA